MKRLLFVTHTSLVWCVVSYFPRPGRCHLVVSSCGVILWCHCVVSPCGVILWCHLVVCYFPSPGRCHLSSAFLPTFPRPRLGQNNKSSLVSINEDIHTQRSDGKHFFLFFRYVNYKIILNKSVKTSYPGQPDMDNLNICNKETNRIYTKSTLIKS